MQAASSRVLISECASIQETGQFATFQSSCWVFLQFNALCQSIKNKICVAPTMNTMKNGICWTAISFYFTFVIAVINVSGEHKMMINLHEQNFIFVCLEIVMCTVFFTLTALFLSMLFCSSGRSQKTSAALGSVMTLLMGLSHLLDMLGWGMRASSKSSISLMQYAGWIVSTPLLFCMFGHVCKIQQRYVLVGAFLQCLAIITCMIGSLSASTAICWLCAFIAFFLYLPTLVVYFVLCFWLDHWISATQLYEIRLYGTCKLLAFSCFGVLYFTCSFSAITSTAKQILYTIFDSFWILFLSNIVYMFHHKNDVSTYEIKMLSLEKANSAQRLFLRFIFHEVRVPFHSLVLGLDCLAGMEEVKPHQELIQSLVQSAEMINRTLNDVLLLSRLEDGKLDLEAAPFSLHSMARSTLQSFAPMFESKQIELLLQVDSTLPLLLHGDEHRISQILANLVSNAIKFSKEGQHITVVMKTVDQSKSSCYFQIKVQDEGIGMSEEDQKLLFSPYSQIRPHETQQGRGSGLGLSIVKHIVELHDGKIRVTSTPGKGSTFTVTLKLPIPENTLEVQLDAIPQVDEDLETSEVGEVKVVHGVESSVDAHMGECLGASGISECKALDADIEMGRQFNSVKIPENEPAYLDTVFKNASKKYKTESNKIVPVNAEVDLPKPPKCKDKKRGSTFTSLDTEESKGLLSETANASRLTALVVDDSQTNRKLTHMILKQKGFLVDEACNGQEAVDMVRVKEYTVIFMDNQMPIMTGVEATRQICGFCSSPIIGLTGNSLEEDVQEFLNAGAKQVLIKPCKKTDIFGALSSVCNWSPES